jgi:hypothetical protein
MNSYSIRVELHDATWADYVNLAQFLGNNGIVDTILGDDGIRYKMSPGEYNYFGPNTFDKVYTAAVTCAAMTGRKHAVTMAAVTTWRWVGLKPA